MSVSSISNVISNIVCVWGGVVGVCVSLIR